MAGHTLVNLLDDVEDVAPRFGMEGLESRFARGALGLERSGLTLFRMTPGFRTPFGHRHAEQEEVYVVVKGSVRAMVGSDLVEMRPWDALRVAPQVVRCLEAGPDGAEVLAFGAPSTGNQDAEMLPGWWGDEG